jgi:hypothetical protein
MGPQVKNKNPRAVQGLVMPVGPELRGAELGVAHLGNTGVLYDFARVSHNRLVFGLLEVADRSQTTSIIAAAGATFRAQAAELFVSAEVNEADAMIELCLQINRSILNAAGGVFSCPAFAGCYNEDLGTICYFNAGHTPGLVRDETGVSELAPTGLPLGLFSHVTSDARIVALRLAAVFALVSGEAFEITNKDHESGFDRVKQSLQRAKAEGAGEICEALLRDAQSRPGGPVANNAGALVLVRRP